jgi:hypothetical protein
VARLFALSLAVCAGCAPAATATAVPTAAPPTVIATSVATEPPAATLALVDACAILDQQAAEKIAQTPLETGVPGNPVEPSCMYTGPVTGPTAQVQIFIGDGAKKTYDIDVALKHAFVPVPGLADEAYLESNAIFFRKGTTWVAIELVRLNDPKANEQPLIDAATAVAASLP